MAHRRRRRSGDRTLRQQRERKYRLRGGKARTTRFIPDGDSDFACMARLFVDHVAAHADRFGIAAEKIEALNASVTAYRDALCRTKKPDSEGPMATRIKNEMRKKAEAIIRSVARQLRGTIEEEQLTPTDRMALNMPARPKRVKRLACPQVAPVLRYVGSTVPRGRCTDGARHILEYGNDFDPASSAKPHGATRLELFVELIPVGVGARVESGEAIPWHPSQRSGGRLWYLGSFTTRRFEVAFPMMADGAPMLVVYWGRWADSSGGVGPFSQTCIARVEGGKEGPLGAGTTESQKQLPGAALEQRIRVVQVVRAAAAGQLESGRVLMSSAAATTTTTRRELEAGPHHQQQRRQLEAA